MYLPPKIRLRCVTEVSMLFILSVVQGETFVCGLCGCHVFGVNNNPTINNVKLTRKIISSSDKYVKT